jgi:transposase
MSLSPAPGSTATGHAPRIAAWPSVMPTWALAGLIQPSREWDKVRASAATPREALRGRIERQHRFLLQLHMQQIDALDAAIAELDREVATGLACFRYAVERLSTIPGISQLSAQVIVSEIGTDMSRFATDAHLRSWAGLSAQRLKCRQAPVDSLTERSTMAEGCAGSMCLGRSRSGTYLHAKYLRLRSRRGPKKAVCAVAASMLTAAYQMLTDGTFYNDLGPAHFDRRRPETQARRLIRRLADLGFSVELKPVVDLS